MTSGIGSNPEVQLVRVYLSVDDLQLASQAIPRLVPAIRPMIQEINQHEGARIAIVWVSLADRAGKPIMEYLWDLELSVERGGTVQGITGWFGGPLTPLEPTITPVGDEVPAQTESPYP